MEWAGMNTVCFWDEHVGSVDKGRMRFGLEEGGNLLSSLPSLSVMFPGASRPRRAGEGFISSAPIMPTHE